MIIKMYLGGTWVAQSVKRSTLDFGSGNDLLVPEFESRIGLQADTAEPARNSLSPVSLSLSSPPPAHACSNKLKDVF